jgi:DNA-binding response OmpR family regulator
VPTAGAADDDGAGEADEAASGPPIILVVDDHADMRAFLRQELAAYRVEEAADGAEGRARAFDLIPDLIITDLVMPEMDGYDLVRQLREDARTSHVPIIMLTGRSSDDARIAGLETGVDDYLPKPFNARVLRSRVDNLLELRRMLRARFAGEVLLKPEEVAATSLDQKFLERVSRTIEERMSDNSFTVEELASAVAMSRSQLHRKLTALLDRSPGALIRGMRLQRAADLIRSGSRTLGQIAFDVGFSDQAHFIRAFRRQYDCTPSEYRDREPEQS